MFILKDIPLSCETERNDSALAASQHLAFAMNMTKVIGALLVVGIFGAAARISTGGLLPWLRQHRR
jgi:hypothetical protein